MIQSPKIEFRASKIAFHPGLGQSPGDISISRMSPFTQSALCQTQVGIWATVKVCCLGSPLPRPSRCYITCPASQTGNALDLCCLLPPGQRPLTWHMAWKGRLTLGWLTLCHCLVTKLCPTLCDPVTCSTPSFAALHYLPELTQTHVH